MEMERDRVETDVAGVWLYSEEQAGRKGTLSTFEQERTTCIGTGEVNSNERKGGNY